MDLQTKSTPYFLRLPYEIRLAIYEYLLLPSATPSPTAGKSVSNLRPDYSVDSAEHSSDPFTLHVRIIDPCLGVRAKNWRRATFYVRTGHFNTSALLTTYRIPQTPYTAHLTDTIPALLSLNKQIHAEACKVLYTTYTFAFSTNIEAAVPFLSDLTPIARSHIKSIQLTKKPLPHTKEFDRAEWAEVCGYVSRNLNLKTLRLSVVVARPPTAEISDDDEDAPEEGNMDIDDAEPQQLGALLPSPPESPTSPTSPTALTVANWHAVKPITREQFEFVRRMQNEWDVNVEGVDLQWVEQLMQIRNLEDLKVAAVLEKGCGFSSREGTRFWVAFSQSVESGFAEWIREAMIA